MAYEKTTWAKGDVVTSAKLNKMEDGIDSASGSMKVIIAIMQCDTDNNIKTLDIKPSDIFDANNELIAVPLIIVGENNGVDLESGEVMRISYAKYTTLDAGLGYYLDCLDCWDHDTSFFAENANDYFSYHMEK